MSLHSLLIAILISILLFPCFSLFIYFFGLFSPFISFHFHSSFSLIIQLPNFPLFTLYSLFLFPFFLFRCFPVFIQFLTFFSPILILSFSNFLFCHRSTPKLSSLHSLRIVFLLPLFLSLFSGIYLFLSLFLSPSFPFISPLPFLIFFFLFIYHACFLIIFSPILVLLSLFSHTLTVFVLSLLLLLIFLSFLIPLPIFFSRLGRQTRPKLKIYVVQFSIFICLFYCSFSSFFSFLFSS